MAKTAFMKMRSLLINKNIQINTKKRLVKCYIWPVLLYGSESWTTTKAIDKRIEALEMWIWRRILRISWTKKIRTEEVLQLMETRRELTRCYRERGLRFLGHSMRKGGLENNSITGKIEGVRGRGRRRADFVSGMRKYTKSSDTNVDFLRKTFDRDVWKAIVTNV